MGWDAYAVNGIGQSILSELGRENPQFNKYKKAFAIVSRQVNLVANGVDAFLSSGALDCSECAYMLQEATNISCWGRDLSIDDVQTLRTEANWDFEFEPERAWAYYSAKAFLETCAEMRLGIKFSF